MASESRAYLRCHDATPATRARRRWFGATLGAGAAVMAFIGQRRIGALQGLEGHDLFQRTAEAAYGLAFYLRKTLVPLGLSPMYPLEIDVRPLDAKYVVGLSRARPDARPAQGRLAGNRNTKSPSPSSALYCGV